MRKLHAIHLLGGTVKAAAANLGISSSAVSQWPDDLPRAAEDRVLAFLARKHLPPELIGPPDEAELQADPNPVAARQEAGHAA